MVRLRFLLPCKTSGQNSRGKDPQETEVVSTIGMEYHPNNQASNRSTSITSSQVKSNQVKPITSVNQWTKQPHNQSFTTFKYPTNSAIHITGDYPGGRLPRCLRQPLTNRLNIIFEGVWASHPWKSRQLKWIWLWRGWDEKHQFLIAIYKIYKLVLKVDDGFLT